MGRASIGGIPHAIFRSNFMECSLGALASHSHALSLSHFGGFTQAIFRSIFIECSLGMLASHSLFAFVFLPAASPHQNALEFGLFSFLLEFV